MSKDSKVLVLRSSVFGGGLTVEEAQAIEPAMLKGIADTLPGVRVADVTRVGAAKSSLEGGRTVVWKCGDFLFQETLFFQREHSEFGALYRATKILLHCLLTFLSIGIKRPRLKAGPFRQNMGFETRSRSPATPRLGAWGGSAPAGACKGE